jgi:20S proteasome alpha/beta subunit
MTLIIILKCKNGIVMASDGQATSFSTGGPIRQRIQKIFKLTGDVLFGASGSVGTIQKCKEIFEQFSQQLSNTFDLNIRNQIRQSLFGIMKSELDRHKAFHDKLEGAPLADILVCVRLKDGNCKIWHIAPDCAEEFLDELGYGCSGIGDTFAYTLLKRYYSDEIDIEGGKLVAYRVIKEAIEIGAFGLGEPIDIWVLDKTTGEIKELTREEIMGLDDTLAAWKNIEREVFKRMYVK